jgi:hypothetical protein
MAIAKTNRVAAAASTNATLLKGAPGRVTGFKLCNNTAAAKYFKFYDKATAPVVGTDVPKFTVIIPVNSSSGQADFAAGFEIYFNIGIAYAITGAVADSDATAVAANDVHGFVQTI